MIIAIFSISIAVIPAKIMNCRRLVDDESTFLNFGMRHCGLQLPIYVNRQFKRIAQYSKSTLKIIRKSFKKA